MEQPVLTPSESIHSYTHKMHACQYQGKGDLKWTEVPIPLITDPTDAIIQVTATSICGSDLHLYHGRIPGVSFGNITGHEAVGFVLKAGTQCKKFKKGDRVVLSGVIACGKCSYCRRKEYSSCDTTNKSKYQEGLYGHHIGAVLGYGKMLGGYEGCQAEYVRVPFADVNLFHIPNELSDKQALAVADFASSGYHGAELAQIKEGDNVVIFGCGPVGLMTQMWAKYRGAARVAAIDIDERRLKFAQEYFGSELINPKNEDPIEAARRLFPGGPDKVIDCVGFRPPEGFFRKIEEALKLESDVPNIVNMAIQMVRKNGTVTLIGDYLRYCDHFNLGALMEKHLTINGGHASPQSYYHLIFDAMKAGKVDPTVIFTHTFPFTKIGEVYKILDKHEGGVLKPYLIPDTMLDQSTF